MSTGVEKKYDMIAIGESSVIRRKYGLHHIRVDALMSEAR